MRIRQLIAGVLLTTTVVAGPLAVVAHAEPSGGSGATYCYRDNDTAKQFPYSPGSTYTDWSTNPPTTYQCGADGNFVKMQVVKQHPHHGYVPPASTQAHA